MGVRRDSPAGRARRLRHRPPCEGPGRWCGRRGQSGCPQRLGHPCRDDRRRPGTTSSSTVAAIAAAPADDQTSRGPTNHSRQSIAVVARERRQVERDLRVRSERAVGVQCERAGPARGDQHRVRWKIHADQLLAHAGGRFGLVADGPRARARRWGRRRRLRRRARRDDRGRAATGCERQGERGEDDGSHRSRRTQALRRFMRVK